jgi:hypothetical protein
MGRLLKLIASVFVLAAGGAAALAAGSAPAQSRSHMIICPLEPNDTITTTCCGPPVATATGSPAFVCCGTPQPIACPIGLTLSSFPNPSVAGQKITLTGRSPGNTAGQTVELFQELPGAKTFSKVASAKTGSLGEFKFVRKGVETNRKWYVAVGSLHSLAVDQRVKARVTLGASRLRAHGQVSPSHAGERILFEQHTSSGWSVLARPLLNVNSAYSVTLPGHREVDFRAVFPGDRRNMRSSASLVVTA